MNQSGAIGLKFGPIIPVLLVAAFAASPMTVPAAVKAQTAVSIDSASPDPNYTHTRDPDDLKQLVDAQLSGYPIWTSRDSVGWSDRTPVLLRGRVNGDDSGSGITVFRLLVAKGVYAGVYPPRRIDVYCQDDADKWLHVGEREVASADISDRATTWLDIAMVRSCTGQFALVAHATGMFLMIDEIAVERGDQKVIDTAIAESVATNELVSDSVRRLRRQLEQKEIQLRAGMAGTDSVSAMLFSPWQDLPDIANPADAGKRDLDLVMATGSPAQYVLALANPEDRAREYTITAGDEVFGPAKYFRIAPVIAADGQTVYDPLVPLAGNKIMVPAGSIEYLWLEHPVVYAPGSIPVEVSSPDGWHEALTVRLQLAGKGDSGSGVAPDVSVWAYSSDAPIWDPDEKPDVVRLLREAGVNVFVIHPDSIPVPGQSNTWKVREKRLRADLKLYRGAGTVLLFLGWDDRLTSAYRQSRQFRADLEPWLQRLREVLRSEGYDYGDWAIYPVDEPEAADYNLLLKAGRWIKAIDPKVRLYANPGRIAAGDLESGSQLADLLDLVDLWQPEKTAAEVLGPHLGNKRRWWIYQVGVAPAKKIYPVCYRRLGWEADRLGASGFGFWSFSDTGGTTAWDDLDGRRPDWAAVYEGPDGPVSSRRWEGFKAGIRDFRQLRACRNLPTADAGKDPGIQCAAFRSSLDADPGGGLCR